jgi:S-DNA-T family DNA segregation ATPase FtsK/SpoIIIE
MGAFPLGLCDRPEQQSQPVYSPTLESLGGVLICGAGGSGRTSALRSLIVQATSDPGEPVWAYAVDASGALADLTVLPGVGSVARASDRAGTLRLLRWLEGQIEARTRAFEAARANTLTEYRVSSGRPLPRLLFCLDSFEEAEELLPPSREQDPCALFASCAMRGRRLGIHAAVCASRPSRIPSELRSVLKTVFPLRQQDAASAGACGAPDHFGDPSHPPGRTWVDGAEIQLGLLCPGALSRLATQAAGRLLPAAAPPSPPARLVLDELGPAEDGRPPIGVDLETLQPLGIPPTGVVLVQGQTGSGRTTALRTLRDALRKSRPGARRLLFTPHRGELLTVPGWDQIFEGVDAVTDGIREYLQAPRSDDILVVERAADLAETPAGEVLGQLLKGCGHGPGSVLLEISGPELRGAWALATAVRAPRAALLLDPPPGEALGELGSEAPLERPVSRRPGVGILVERGRARHLLVALPRGTTSEQLLPGLHPESDRQEGGDHQEHRPHEL